MASFITRYIKRWALNKIRGPLGEAKTATKMWLSLNSKTYIRFHDLIIPSKSGTTQIDHIVVSPFGVFIVETKNKGGWIFGSEDQPKWTQTFGRKKYTFQNPLKQLYRQRVVLSQFLGLKKTDVHGVVCFTGRCKFKTPMPNNVLRSGPGSYIKLFNTRVFTDEEVTKIVNNLTNFISESNLTKRDHLKSLQKRHNSGTNCPRCGSEIKIRTAKKGRNAGSKFLGCSGFPKCRFTKKM